MSRWLRSVNRIGLILVPMLVLAAGCTARTAAPVQSARPPFADCAALTAPPSPGSGFVGSPSVGPAAPPSVAPPSVGPPAAPRSVVPADDRLPAGGQPLPDATLPCVSGGGQVRLGALRGPAVVNLWASWCGPCRKELPALQRFATRAAGSVHVIGVVTRDDPNSAGQLASELNVSFPALHDPGQQVLRAVRRVGLPVTVLVDRDGMIRRIHAKDLDEAGITALVEQDLGVRVPA